MHIFTNPVKNYNGGVDGITYNRQHTGNKCGAHGYLHNRIKGKNHQYVMNQSDNGARAETDILKPQPDIKQHADSGNHNGNHSIRFHLAADGGADGFRGNLLRIYRKIVHHHIFQLFPLVQI